MVRIDVIRFDTKQLCILLTQFVYVFNLILRVNSEMLR